MFNKQAKIHEALTEKVNSHLIDTEEIMGVAHVAPVSYFLTQFRIITMQSTNKKGKNALVKSIYFNSITSVTYSDMATKKRPYDMLIIQINGNVINSTFNLVLPTEFAHKAYNEINTAKAVVR